MKLLEKFRSLCAIGIDGGISEELFHFVVAGQDFFQNLFLLLVLGLKRLEKLVKRIALFGLLAFELSEIIAGKAVPAGSFPS